MRTSTADYPTGRELIAAYKLTGAIPDYHTYWTQNGHLHACAVGVLLGADAIGRGDDPELSVRRMIYKHRTLAKLNGMGGAARAARAVEHYEHGVHAADTDSGRPSIGVYRPCDEEYGVAYDAGYAAWAEVLEAVARGELPDLPAGH